MHTDFPTAPDGAQRPMGLNHVVLNVRDIEESHRFWTDSLGFRQAGASRPGKDGSPHPQMRFYSGDHDGHLTHHDIALVERPDLPPTAAGRPSSGLNHVAIAMPNREAWLKQLAFLRRREIAFARRVDRGATRSVHIADPNGHEVEILYELPREGWERDIDAALNYGRALPTDGDEALVDDAETPVFGTASEPRGA